jgi:NAD-dependent SIR2 family protein deacetylase
MSESLLERASPPIDELRAMVLGGPGVVVLTGAGMSTDSGIPDYRGPNAIPRSPMTFQEFASGPVTQQRYWARSYLGWQRMFRAEPNAGHRALAQLETDGQVTHLITQNVDGLHRRAGSRAVIDLHGRVDEVVCLGCRRVTRRDAVQERLAAANPDFVGDSSLRTAPDGDVDLEATHHFRVVHCEDCEGVLKPHVVFFGESVPRTTVEECFAAVESARALLVLGSSLTVHSGLRFVRRAHRVGVPVAIVNRGATRGDELATLRVDAECTETLVALSAG